MIARDRELLARLGQVNASLGEVVLALMAAQDGGELPADGLREVGQALRTLAEDMIARTDRTPTRAVLGHSMRPCPGDHDSCGARSSPRLCEAGQGTTLRGLGLRTVSARCIHRPSWPRCCRSMSPASQPAMASGGYFNGRRGAIPPEHGDLPVAVYTQTGRGDRRAVARSEALLRFRADRRGPRRGDRVAHSGMC